MGCVGRAGFGVVLLVWLGDGRICGGVGRRGGRLLGRLGGELGVGDGGGGRRLEARRQSGGGGVGFVSAGGKSGRRRAVRRIGSTELLGCC